MDGYMKSITMKSFGDVNVMEWKEVPLPSYGPHELLIKVHAAGVNRCDIIQRQGTYQVPPSNSPVLGIEIAGSVVEVGTSVKHFKKGDKVFGYVNGGGYAEYCVQDAGFAIPLPTDWSFTEGAAIAEVFQTANESLFTHGALQANESVLIHGGASGVGLAAIQMAKSVGAKVIITTSSDEKIKACLDHGADFAINYQKEDFVEKVLTITNQKGVDLLLDSVGPAYLMRNINSVKMDGRLILIGLLSGHITEFDLAKFIAKRLTMKGHNTRARELAEQRLITHRFKTKWLPLLQQKKIYPTIYRVYSIHDVALAHQCMEENKNIGKIILNMETD